MLDIVFFFEGLFQGGVILAAGHDGKRLMLRLWEFGAAAQRQAHHNDCDN